MSETLSVRGLTKRFETGGRFLRQGQILTAVNNVSFDVAPGKTFGLVGESGCGKSTLARCLMRLTEPDAGCVMLGETDITALSASDLFAVRPRMQIVFQDPYASLNPRRTIAQTLLEPLATHRIGPPGTRLDRVVTLLEQVGLNASMLNRYPHEFSGGQRQRVGIARALTLDPEVIVADEAVSALDVSVQSEVLNLLADIQRARGLSYVFISHDLAVVQHVSDQIGVMRHGELVELGAAADVFLRPQHAYTRRLLAAVPDMPSLAVRD
ncbi:MAG: ATP-binding cassette domain-containing protein [Pseudomonadota bacterium]